MEFRDLKKQYEVLKNEIDREINDVITSAQFISGAKISELEEKLSDYEGVKHCITCANGTDALTLALMAWGIGKGDVVFVPDFTFFSSGECPAAVGAIPVFVEVNAHTFNLDFQKLEEAINKVILEGKYKPRVVVAVDLFGQPADYLKIKQVCEKYDLLLLEDGAQGFGGTLNGKKACGFGDISTTSFFPAKPLGCYGDGGAVFTNNDEWATLIRSLAVHGKGNDNKYDNIRLGMNSRLDTIQAAILMPNFKAFVEFQINVINEIAEQYTAKLNHIVKCPIILSGYTSSWAQYTIRLKSKSERDGLKSFLREFGIPSNIYYVKPMHKQAAFNDIKYCWKNLSTQNLCDTVLSLPLHPYMSKLDVIMITNRIEEHLLKNICR